MTDIFDSPDGVRGIVGDKKGSICSDRNPGWPSPNTLIVNGKSSQKILVFS